MDRLNWDVDDVVGVVSVLPKVEEYDISHTFDVCRGGIRAVLSIWQLESFIDIKIYEKVTNNLIVDLCFFCRNGVIVNHDAMVINFINCVFVESQFSYIDNEVILDVKKYPFRSMVRLWFDKDIIRLKVMLPEEC